MILLYCIYQWTFWLWRKSTSAALTKKMLLLLYVYRYKLVYQLTYMIAYFTGIHSSEGPDNMWTKLGEQRNWTSDLCYLFICILFHNSHCNHVWLLCKDTDTGNIFCKIDIVWILKWTTYLCLKKVNLFLPQKGHIVCHIQKAWYNLLKILGTIVFQD